MFLRSILFCEKVFNFFDLNTNDPNFSRITLIIGDTTKEYNLSMICFM